MQSLLGQSQPPELADGLGGVGTKQKSHGARNTLASQLRPLSRVFTNHVNGKVLLDLKRTGW